MTHTTDTAARYVTITIDAAEWAYFQAAVQKAERGDPIVELHEVMCQASRDMLDEADL